MLGSTLSHRIWRPAGLGCGALLAVAGIFWGPLKRTIPAIGPVFTATTHTPGYWIALVALMVAALWLHQWRKETIELFKKLGASAAVENSERERVIKYTAPPQDPMDMLAEEGLEVAHERMKAIRFGWEGTPEWRARGIGTPRDRFVQEVGDFLAALDHALAQGKITVAELEAAKLKKHKRLLDLFGLEQPSPSPPASMVTVPRRFRHKKRGTTYTLIGDAQVQCPEDHPLTEYEVVTVYRSDAGPLDDECGLWVRRKHEFEDGRFEELAAAPSPAQPRDLEGEK